MEKKRRRKWTQFQWPAEDDLDDFSLDIRLPPAFSGIGRFSELRQRAAE